MRIKNLDKVKEMLKSKLPEYLAELGLKIENTHVQCPNNEVHQSDDLGKLSAAFLPKSNNTALYCFVENRCFDIFDIYSMRNKKTLTGEGFYKIIEELAAKYKVPLETEEEYSVKEQEHKKKQKVLEEIHALSLKNIKDGVELYKKRGLTKEKIQMYRIGYLTPSCIAPELNKRFKLLYDYSLLAVFSHPGLVIPVLNKDKQYVGLIVRQYGAAKGDEYLNISLNGKNLYNINNVKDKEDVTVVEGVFDTIALYPNQNVVGCLTSTITDKDLEQLAGEKFKKISLALDPDNLYTGMSRDGFLKAILKLKNVDSDIFVVKIPTSSENKPDPDEFMRTHSLAEFNALPRVPALTYVLECYNKKLIQVETLYAFVAGCPNIIKREQMVTELAKALNIGKRQLLKSLETLADSKETINLIQYTQEKECFEELLESFTDAAWNKQYQGIPSGFTNFDKMFGGFEDTFYLMVGYPEMGKTTFLLNFAYRLAENPSNLVAFYSLDDGAKRAVLPRMMSVASGLTSKQIKMPGNELKEQWFVGMKKMMSMRDNMILKDGSEVRTITEFENLLNIHKNIAQEREKKLIVVVDNLHDIISSEKFESVQNTQRVASFLKRLPQKIACPIIATAEVPKSAKDVPTGKDIKESIDMWYAARFVAGIYSNFHNDANKQGNLTWQDENGAYNPIIRFHVSKNQTGDCTHGSIFFRFHLKTNRLMECTEEENITLKDGQLLI